jgi:putative ABC transport system permease protein
VVGVVHTVKQNGLDADTRPAVYFPNTQLVNQTMFIVARTANAESVSRLVRGLDPDQPVYGVSTMGDVLWKSLARQRFSLVILSALAVFAALLAGIGVFGVMSYLVTESTHDIGVRMALGAQPGAILGMVVRRGMVLALAGLALGLGLAAALTGLIRSLLFGVPPLDLPTFAFVAGFLSATAAIASYIPALRAASVDPVRALQGN